MNEFEEKLPNEEFEEALDEAELEGESDSSVFTDPAAHRDKGVMSKKNRIIIGVSLMLSLAVLLAGIFTYDKEKNTIFGIKLPNAKDKTSTSIQNTADPITVVSKDSSDISVFTISNKNGDFNCYWKLDETDENKGAKIWCLEGLDSSKTSSESIEYLAKNACQIVANRIVKSRDEKDCGFDKPQAKIDVVLAEGKGSYSITIGDNSADKTGSYLKITGDDNIYIVSKEYAEYFNFNRLDLSDISDIAGVEYRADAATYFDDNKVLSTFDKIILNSKAYKNELAIIPNKNEEQKDFIPFLISSPYNRYADNAEAIMYAFMHGIPSVGAYSYDTSPASLKAVGLDDPDVKIKLTAGTITHIYEFAFTEDGFCAMVDYKKDMIKKIDIADAAYIEYAIEDFYSQWLCMEMVTQLSSFEAKLPDKSYKFGITLNEDSTSNADRFTVVRENGKTITTTLFQEFYTSLLGIKINDFAVNDISASPDLTLNFTYSSDYSVKEYKFYKVSDTKYQYSIDGIMQGKISATNFNKLVKNIKLIAENKQIVP